jgi:hypothetical protein
VQRLDVTLLLAVRAWEGEGLITRSAGRERRERRAAGSGEREWESRARVKRWQAREAGRLGAVVVVVVTTAKESVEEVTERGRYSMSEF